MVPLLASVPMPVPLPVPVPVPDPVPVPVPVEVPVPLPFAAPVPLPPIVPVPLPLACPAGFPFGMTTTEPAGKPIPEPVAPPIPEPVPAPVPEPFPAPTPDPGVVFAGGRLAVAGDCPAASVTDPAHTKNNPIHITVPVPMLVINLCLIRASRFKIYLVRAALVVAFHTFHRGYFIDGISRAFLY